MTPSEPPLDPRTLASLDTIDALLPTPSELRAERAQRAVSEYARGARDSGNAREAIAALADLVDNHGTRAAADLLKIYRVTTDDLRRSAATD
ncbi:hypothetical protein [Cryptosporangium japonicum]|uniref:Uncharacterized protein n=1 Tax=Cryptosporangium japonicum TaxID=80872 RepID=A0ABN0UDH9_9ACTN